MLFEFERNTSFFPKQHHLTGMTGKTLKEYEFCKYIQRKEFQWVTLNFIFFHFGKLFNVLHMSQNFKLLFSNEFSYPLQPIFVWRRGRGGGERMVRSKFWGDLVPASVWAKRSISDKNRMAKEEKNVFLGYFIVVVAFFPCLFTACVLNVHSNYFLFLVDGSTSARSKMKTNDWACKAYCVSFFVTCFKRIVFFKFNTKSALSDYSNYFYLFMCC